MFIQPVRSRCRGLGIALVVVLVELQFSSLLYADIIITAVPHIVMNEGGIQEGDFTIFNNASFPVTIDSQRLQALYLRGDPTDIPSDLLSQQVGNPVIPAGGSFVSKWNIISSFDDSPFDNDNGFSALILFVDGFKSDDPFTEFSAQGTGDVLVQDIPEPSAIVLFSIGLLSLGALRRTYGSPRKWGRRGHS